MIDFEEELAKFKPSREIEEVEGILRSQNVADVADILAEILKEKDKQNS